MNKIKIPKSKKKETIPIIDENSEVSSINENVWEKTAPERKPISILLRNFTRYHLKRFSV